MIRRLLKHVATPDSLDMIEHYASRAERLADLWVHAVGLGLAAAGGVVLAVLAAAYAGVGAGFAAAVYALCLTAMLTASTVYNLARPSPARPVLRRLDEAAIFLMIAGSYTPFTAVRFDGGWALGFTVLVWALALAGVTAKLLLPRLSDAVWSLVYIAFGWLALAMIRPLAQGVPLAALILLAAGGLIYTAGVLVFISPRVPFRRAIWHGFVVAGAGAHWAAVLVGVALAPN